MAVERIDYLYLETANWGKAVRFWQALGFRLALDLGHSGRLEPPQGGPGIFLEEVPGRRSLGMQIFLRGPEAPAPGEPALVTKGWHDSHWGTRLLVLSDPDGRTVVVQAYPPAGGRRP
ncbi:MAG TPA: VOC family protein [bacterium]|nr:VOC family protein [bacterium]